MFEQAVGDRSAPTLALLAEAGEYRRGVTTFPSLTPVCLTSIATGAHPDVHHIPHLVWWNRQEKRDRRVRLLVRRDPRRGHAALDPRHDRRHEPGSPREGRGDAVRGGGARGADGRGGQHHLLSRPPPLPADGPGIAPATFGPRRFFFYNLYESDPIGAPLSVRNRARGSVDDYATAAARWLVTRDGFDLLVYYLSDLDFASHALGPDGVREQLTKTDRSVGALVEAAGGIDDFLARYAVLVCSDHGQTHVHHAARLQDQVQAPAIVTASNRAGMIYTDEPRVAAASLDAVDAVDATFFLEDDEVVARRHGDEDAALLDEFPLGRERVEAALRNPNAGDVLVSAALGWEFADLAGSHHVGGGSHGSLVVGDSEVPMLGVGIEPPARTIDVKDALLASLLAPVP